jgi:hypothetical protein
MLAKEVAAEQAIDLVVSEAKPIALEEAQERAKVAAETAAAAPKKRKPAARKKPAKPKDELWTPDKDAEAAAAKKLWTPDA